jgi:sulfur carrier protein
VKPGYDLIEMPTIHVNGEAISLPSACSVADLLRERRLDRAPCAVEVNRQVVPKRQHAEHALRDGDVVEIVTLVGGG